MYKCKYCGKDFEKLQSLVAHYRHCKLNPNFDEEKYKQKNKEISKKSHDTQFFNNQNKEENIKKERILICKNCGKEYKLNLSDKEFINGKYSKFCSRSCANTRHHSEETKKKIGLKIKKIINENPTVFKSCHKPIGHYIIYCKECGKEIIYDGQKNKKIYCSKECKHNWLSKHTGGYRLGSGHSKSGWYKGIRCDSTWELAFLIYHLDNNLYIERCNIKRKYIWKNKEHVYYPDFITDKGIIEIKGYKTEQSEEKRKQNPDIINIYKEDIQFYLDYIKEKYDKPLIYLYDNSKPNNDFLNNKNYIWMHNNMLKLNTMIKPIKYKEYLNNGWIHGRRKYGDVDQW